MTTACSAMMSTAVLTMPLLTWRCRRGCGRIILRLEYDGRSILEHICKCNKLNRLPDDIDHVRLERRQ